MPSLSMEAIRAMNYRFQLLPLYRELLKEGAIVTKAKTMKREDLETAIYKAVGVYDPNKDVGLLHARVKACEDEVYRLQKKVPSSKPSKRKTL